MSFLEVFTLFASGVTIFGLIVGITEILARIDERVR